MIFGWGGPGLPEAALDEGVAAFQPSAVGIEVVLGEGAAPPQQRGGRAGGGQAHHGQQGRAGAQHAGQNLPVAQLGGAGDAQGRFETQALGDLVDRPEGAKALGWPQAQRGVGPVGELGQGVQRLGQGAAHGGQEGGGQVGEDGEGLGFDGGADAVGLAQEDGGVGLAALAFGDNFGDKHAYSI